VCCRWEKLKDVGDVRVLSEFESVEMVEEGSVRWYVSPVGQTSKSGGRANEGDKVFVVGW